MVHGPRDTALRRSDGTGVGRSSKSRRKQQNEKTQGTSECRPRAGGGGEPNNNPAGALKNHRARRFYEKHGFRRVGTLTFPYGDTVGINHVMEKLLK